MIYESERFSSNCGAITISSYITLLDKRKHKTGCTDLSANFSLFIFICAKRFSVVIVDEGFNACMPNVCVCVCVCVHVWPLSCVKLTTAADKLLPTCPYDLSEQRV